MDTYHPTVSSVVFPLCRRILDLPSVPHVLAFEDISHIGGVPTSVSYFNLVTASKAPSPNIVRFWGTHVLRCWGLGPRHMNVGALFTQ